MTSDPNIPMICDARQVARQLRKVLNLPNYMLKFTIAVDMQEDTAEIDAKFLFDESMLKDDNDASERTTTGSETVAEQGKTDGAAGTAEALQEFRPAEARDESRYWEYGSQ